MNKLLAHLTEESAVVDAFLKLLDEEEAAMTNGGFDTLSAITEHKAQLVDRIATLDLERERQLMAGGYPVDRDGADAAAAAGGVALQRAWETLLALAAQAQKRNHHNGVLIHTHLNYTRHSINQLRGKSQSLYGPDGKHKGALGYGNNIASG